MVLHMCNRPVAKEAGSLQIDVGPQLRVGGDLHNIAHEAWGLLGGLDTQHPDAPSPTNSCLEIYYFYSFIALEVYHAGQTSASRASQPLRKPR